MFDSVKNIAGPIISSVAPFAGGILNQFGIGILPHIGSLVEGATKQIFDTGGREITRNAFDSWWIPKTISNMIGDSVYNRNLPEYNNLISNVAPFVAAPIAWGVTKYVQGKVDNSKIKDPVHEKLNQKIFKAKSLKTPVIPIRYNLSKNAGQSIEKKIKRLRLGKSSNKWNKKIKKS